MLRRLLDLLRAPKDERALAVSPLAAGAVAATVFALFAGLAFTSAGRALENVAFDFLSVSTAPEKSSLPITIIGIDEASFAEVGKQFPWPRSLHAKLIRSLADAGALVVAFDVLMADASVEAEDAELAQAIAEAKNVVLVSDRAYQESAYVRQWIRVDPLPLFRAAGAGAGLASVNPDPDQVVRRVPEGEDVFWREIIRRANVRAPGVIKEPQEKPYALIRYLGPDKTFPTIPYYQALDAKKYLPPGALRDQIVIVGLDVRSSVNAQSKIPDQFGTPFTARTGWLTPGAELHANILEGAITNRVIVPAGLGWQLALLAVVTALSAALLRRWRPILSFLVALALVAALAAVCATLFMQLSVWLPVLGAIGCVAACYLFYGVSGYVAERRRRAEIRRAFQLYVAPEVVDHMLAQPGRLTFGGESRTITVLFTDLAGFTTLSEKHGRDVVARVLQQHFTRMTAIVKRRRGTVIQFIGDALMAIWGAPLEDPDHAKHACEAAREMQADMELLRKELAAQGLPEIRMRIGIHTCECYVGNFGAEDHFYYTALGDGVNLASRLEGANKAFGTGILVSGATTAALGPEAPLRTVSRIIVKGKSEPVDVFTFDDDADICALTQQAIDAFGRREWDTAHAHFEALATRRKDDGVAAHYMAWIASARETPPGDAWDRSEALEKL